MVVVEVFVAILSGSCFEGSFPGEDFVSVGVVHVAIEEGVEETLEGEASGESGLEVAEVEVGGQTVSQSRRRALPWVIQFSASSGRKAASASLCPR